MGKIIAIVLVFGMIVGLVGAIAPSSPVLADDPVVTFPDANLEAAIREAIGKPAGDIYASDLDGLTLLDAQTRSISDLTGLEHCANLTTLYLGWNHQISDISPLSNLTNLTELWLSGNQITDLSPLANLSSLTFLCLYGNQVISDISPLANLTGLTELNIGWNQISDISPLAGLTSLIKLEFWWNQVSDISPLANLTDLTELGFSGWWNQVSDLSPLTNLTSLTILFAQGNQIADVSALSGLTEMRAVFLDNNPITDITPLMGLTKLGEVEDERSLRERACKKVCLGLQNNQIKDISPLVENEGLAKEDGIDLRGNPLSEETLDTYIPQLHQRGVNVLYLNAPQLQSPPKYAVINTTTPTLTWTQEDPHNAIRKNIVYIEQITGSDTAEARGETGHLCYEFLIDATTSFNLPDGYLTDGEKYSWRVGAATDTEGACEEACSEPWYFTIHKTYEETRKAAIIVDEAIASDIEANLNRYVKDVESIYGIEILQYNKTWSDSIHLRAFIQDLYNDFDIDGVILVGDLPYALWEFPWGEICPLPFYYADMDGTFEDRDSNGIFDHYDPGLNEGPEIWVSWMRPDSDNVVSSLNDYLEKCHNYYCGNIRYQDKALVCIDKDWGGAVAPITADLLQLYPEVVSIGGPGISVSPEQYVRKYVNWYEITDVWSHSSSSAHYFSGGLLPGSEIKLLSGGSKLTLIWGCHAGDFHETPVSNLAVSYVFDNSFGLASIAATRSIGIAYHEAVFHSLSSGRILGDAFFDWLTLVYDESFIETRFPEDDVNRFMWDFILIGNPFMVFNNKTSQPSNISPPDGATGISIAPILNSSPFSDPDLGDTHLASQWQITTSSGDYSSTVLDSGTDTHNLTSIAIPSGTLGYSTICYWRVRHQDSRGAWSDWSSETSFITLEAVRGCLIATATYGTPMADEVQVLRAFRDEHLMRNPFGRALVAFYYKVSPPIAEFITEQPALKPIVRVGVMPAVAMSTVVVNTTPAEKTALVGLPALVSVALAVWVMRRRRRGPEYM